MRPRIYCPSSLVAALLLLAAVAPDPDPAPLAFTAPDGAAPALRGPDATCPEDQAVDPRLVGLWHRHDAAADGDPLRFYYFHRDGFGIYRYGRVGLTNTHSFDYRAAGGVLDLTFRKTAAAHVPRYRIEEDASGTWLVLRGDPREAGDEVRYRRAPDPTAHACAFGPLTLESTPGAAGGPLGGRLWGEEQRYATGGMGFAIYQLQAQTIDGRGVGWYHRGDYDEWLTESLTYRQQGDRISFGFTLRHEGAQSALSLGEAADGTRTLTLAEDPRDFWRAHTYRDMGPSFATCP
jgi:hypothetical protein